MVYMNNRTLFFNHYLRFDIEKLKDNQAEDVRVSYLKKNLKRKLMTHLTGFNYTELTGVM